MTTSHGKEFRLKEFRMAEGQTLFRKTKNFPKEFHENILPPQNLIKP